MDKQLKILMLEDVESDVGLVDHTLRKSGILFELMRVDTRDEYTAAIRLYSPDIILSDHSLPQFNSIEALKIYKDSGLNIPFILVTGSVSEEFAVMCLKQGADDYILKSNLLRLPLAIRNALTQRSQVQRQIESDIELRKQNLALLKVNQELDNFVYSLSHNIRSPLTSVMGLVGLLRREDENLGGPFVSYLAMMERSVTKLDDTIREIMEYSRNARSEVQTVEISVRNLIDESLDHVKHLPGYERVERSINIMQNHAFYCDPYRLEIILTNLIANSIRYRDETKDACLMEIEVDISHDTANIRIRDNGIGIAPDQLPRVFEMFYRATAASDGAGLGLYIAREAVNKLEGDIHLDSRVGIGTTCSIRLAARSTQ